MLLSKICLITNYNLYESKRYFCEKLSDAFNRHNRETLLVDAQEQALGGEVISAIRKFNPQLMLSFNSLLPISDRKYLWDFLEIPHLTVLVDPALYSVNLTNSPWSILACVDRDDVAAMRSYHFENVFFWPHAIERELKPGKEEEKQFDVVFFGSCYDYESLRVSWRQQNTADINKVLDDAIDLVFSNTRISLAQALVSAWNATKIDPQGIDFITLFYYLDNYTRGRDRVELIKSIDGVNIHVFGELSQDNAVGFLGWEQYLADRKNIILHHSVPFNEYLALLKKAKLCLNSMPFFKNGTHERVITGLACGALPVTTKNVFFESFFHDNEQLIYYAMNEKGSINEKVHALLADETRRRDMVESGRKLAMEYFTWDKRVEELLKEIEPIFARIYADIR